MHYVYSVMYLDDNETFSFSAENYTSNATGMDLTELLSELCNSDVSTLDLWWIVPIVVIMVIIINLYTIR